MNEKRKFPYNGKWITFDEISAKTGLTIDVIKKHLMRDRTASDIIDKISVNETVNIFD